ncbi:AIG2-like family protein [Ceratocystis platani]|uniref:Putative gamma-glutamylcyclotransferase n=1 Tax=Ceratocystis fimbriata f. sp. platani TaxID=88771 RepID=A0A0F8B410_CERFI|nr:AIG2-like family protein [Ceratocystis platani]
MSGDYTAFFYGTLMVPEVFFTVTLNTASPPKALSDLYAFCPAVLKDHARHRVVHEDYPGVIAEQDLFEGPEYQRQSVSVTVLDKNGKEVKEVKTNTYIFIDANLLEKREWDIEEFKSEKLSLWTRNEFVFEGCLVPANVKTNST